MVKEVPLRPRLGDCLHRPGTGRTSRVRLLVHRRGAGGQGIGVVTGSRRRGGRDRNGAVGEADDPTPPRRCPRPGPYFSSLRPRTVWNHSAAPAKNVRPHHGRVTDHLRFITRPRLPSSAAPPVAVEAGGRSAVLETPVPTSSPATVNVVTHARGRQSGTAPSAGRRRTGARDPPRHRRRPASSLVRRVRPPTAVRSRTAGRRAGSRGGYHQVFFTFIAFPVHSATCNTGSPGGRPAA